MGYRIDNEDLAKAIYNLYYALLEEDYNFQDSKGWQQDFEYIYNYKYDYIIDSAEQLEKILEERGIL